ncbi:MAG: hypothetical protein PHC64_05845 [Candidatus Gastranaerophilales bacterium]|nr:hypothetical protein [Candidatus Gastranaerophilales bacterium]
MNKKILLLMFTILGLAGNVVFASDNVLQAIQIDGVNDSYNIILKSDDIAELKKTVQAPNKMILNLKGIRASKTINTIYNNTSSVDSVVVEPTGDDSVKISIQGANASNSQIKFDTLKTPLGVLDKTPARAKTADELVLNGPVNSYKPVYSPEKNDNDNRFSLATASSAAPRYIKKAVKSGKANLLMTFGLFILLVVSGFRTIKRNDNEIKVGLSQGLREREIEMYRGGLNHAIKNDLTMPNPQSVSPSANYGIKAYQSGMRSSYLTSEMQRPRPSIAPAPSVNIQQAAKNINSAPKPQVSMPNTIQKTIPAAVKPKTANIDSMKFLESMTKIYEKNGRTDLAQGLKANMKKAKVNLA